MSIAKRLGGFYDANVGKNSDNPTPDAYIFSKLLFTNAVGCVDIVCRVNQYNTLAIFQTVCYCSFYSSVNHINSKMKITVKRIFKGKSYTIGKLYIDGQYVCDTIEDVVRKLPAKCPDTPKGAMCGCKEKVFAETAIPADSYKVTMEYSPRFKKTLPYLHNVPHFLGVLIHSGNLAEHSSGCIIVGLNKVKGQVVESRATMDKLMGRIKDVKDLTIEII